MKKILLVASVQSHIAQFHKPLIRWLQAQGCQVDVAAGNNLEAKPQLRLEIPGKIYDIPFSRSPFSLRNLRSYLTLRKLITTGAYDVIHCNTPVAGVLTRIAANPLRRRGKTRVLYEAHGFHFFTGGPKRNWMLWYPVEKWLAGYTDVLVTINSTDHALALRKFSTKKILRIPGVGLDLTQFETPEAAVDLRREFGLSPGTKIVMSVGELNKNKNHQVIIRALAHLHDPDIHYFALGNGPLRPKLERLSRKLGQEGTVHFLGYRRDIPALLNNADIYVLPSLREGLGMSALEAMASGLPLLTSNRHGIPDYSEAGLTGYLYHPMDYRGFAEGIRRLLQDGTLRQQMGARNREISRRFSLEKALEPLCAVYRELLDLPSFPDSPGSAPADRDTPVLG